MNAPAWAEAVPDAAGHRPKADRLTCSHCGTADLDPSDPAVVSVWHSDGWTLDLCALCAPRWKRGDN